MTIYRVQAPDGSILRIEGPEGAAPERIAEVARSHWNDQSNAKYRALSKPGTYDPTEDMSFGQTLAAGAGKAIYDVGRGVKQMFSSSTPTMGGLVTGDLRSQGQQDVDEAAALDRNLMRTWGGNIGNIGAQTAMALMPGGALSLAGKAAKIPALASAGKLMLGAEPSIAGIASGAGAGAIQAGIQPVETGHSRLTNAAIGAGAGALVPTAGTVLRTGKAAVEPLYPQGREQILGRALRRAGGESADAAMQSMRTAGELVPGSVPTAGQAAGNAGIAALERSAFASEPTVTNTVAERLAQQNEARVSALRDIAGTAGERDFHDAARSQAADELYSKAYEKGVDITRHPELGQFLPKAEIAGVKGEITKLMKRPAIVDAMNQARTLAANEGVRLDDPSGSVKGLDYVKRALDDKISSSQGNEQRILVALKNRLLTTIDRLSPDYAQARVTFSEMSKPINAMDTAAEIAKRSIRSLDEQMLPGAYAKALRDETAQQATGFNKATLAGTMEPGQMDALNAIKADLARAEFAKNAGRGAGSDTVQKFAFNNLMQQSGLQAPPAFLNQPVMIAEYLGRSVYGSADREMRRMLAEALLDPKRAADLMAGASPAQRSALIQALRSSAAPLAVGGATSSLNR